MIPFSICLGVATVYLVREKCVAGYQAHIVTKDQPTNLTLPSSTSTLKKPTGTQHSCENIGTWMVTIGEGNSYEHPESWISKHTTEKNNLNMIEHEQD